MDKDKLKFFKSVENKLCGDKKFLIISGASSSGKSFISNELVKYLNEQGKKTCLISADNYYKGITRMIVQKALINNEYSKEIKEKVVEICKIVKKIINDTPFPQKLCEDNANLIKANLSKIIDNKTAERLTKDIQTEFARINFDEPFAVDLKLLVKHIEMLNNGEDIIVPDYSFTTGEIEYYEKNRVKASDYDFFVIEGIYALNEKVTQNLNKDIYVSGAIECDLKSLISRKLDRDITKQRSKLPKEQIIMSYLTQVMPSFFEYIYPTLKNVDIRFCSSLTDEEVDDRKENRQQKFYGDSLVYDYLATNGSFKKIENQKDYFFEDKFYSSNKNIVLRVREVNGKAVSLTIKTNEDIKNLNRKVEEYSFDGFSDESVKIENVLNKLISSGFYCSNIVEKTRQIYEYKGNIVKLDNVDGKIYLEVDEKQNSKNLELKPCNAFCEEVKGDEINKFLVSEINDSYYQMKKQELSEENVHNECELKLKLSENIKNFIKTNCNTKNCKLINQKYLDLSNDLAIKFIKSFLPENVNISMFSEARIRKVNNKKCYLTLKSAGNLERYEYEKEIPLCLAENLDKNIVKGLINKARYDIMLNEDITISIDVYLDRKLYIAEVEFDKQKFTTEEILSIVKKKLACCEVEDVTSNKNYKNSNLAK